ncbi:MFS transporter [Bacillus sinesaloumensis]|uniref:MFS transporter n=1 Tax=Litchfieldia sinesaloumensis TaxID=1926280 RepID=UPI0009888C8D|nr:glycoside-pentoside-hexuronide (GPH):cation symporter [Bacillus sinesaloumensis]
MKVENEIVNQHLNGPQKKKRKELGLDAQGIQKTMRIHHYLGDGAGQIALNSITGLVGMLTYFYTDKVGLAAGTVGTILLLSRILDAFTDLYMGRLVDGTKSKYGKARPWLLWMTIPALVAIVLLFTIPANASPMIKNIYAFLTVTFATGIVYTAIVIPYGSLMAMRTRSSEERGKMGISRAVFGYAVGMVIAILIIPITNMLGGDQKAWIIVGVVLAVLSSISLYLTFVVSKEDNDVAKNEVDEKVSLLESLKLLFKNKYWVIMLFVMFMLNIMLTLNGSTGVYYTKYILGDENLVAIMGGVGLIPIIIGFAVVGPMIKKFGLARTAQIGLFLGIIATGIRLFMPYSFMAALVFGGIATFATIPMMAIGGVLVNNTVEYGEWQSGKRLVGMVNSASSFGIKIGSGLGAAMIGWTLALGNYDGTLATQPDSAITSILVLTVYLPFALFVACYLILRKYDLDQKYPQIVKELENRKNINN